MDSFAQHPRPDGDLDARCARIRQRLLDGIEDTLDELMLPDARCAAIARAVEAQVVPFTCRLVLCRRTKRCRRQPCKAPAAALRVSELRVSE